MAFYSKANTGIHYSRTGKANQAVVFVHGFLEDLRMWDNFIQRVPQYSVIKLDLPGFGKSIVQESTSINDFAQAVKAVLDKEQIEKAILIGHSMGGYTTLAFAKKYPESLKGICLFHAQPYADTKENKAKRLKSALFVEKHGGKAYVRATVPNLFSKAFQDSKPEVVQQVIKYGSNTSNKAIIAAIHAMRNRKDTSKVLTNINVPVQFIIGTEDAAIPSKNSLRQTTLPAVSDVHIFKNMGHMGHLEAPKKTIRAVRQFIAFVG